MCQAENLNSTEVVCFEGIMKVLTEVDTRSTWDDDVKVFDQVRFYFRVKPKVFLTEIALYSHYSLLDNSSQLRPLFVEDVEHLWA